jgi:hypothetical protein
LELLAAGALVYEAGVCPNALCQACASRSLPVTEFLAEAAGDTTDGEDAVVDALHFAANKQNATIVEFEAVQ